MEPTRIQVFRSDARTALTAANVCLLILYMLHLCRHKSRRFSWLAILVVALSVYVAAPATCAGFCDLPKTAPITVAEVQVTQDIDADCCGEVGCCSDASSTASPFDTPETRQNCFSAWLLPADDARISASVANFDVPVLLHPAYLQIPDISTRLEQPWLSPAPSYRPFVFRRDRSRAPPLYV